MSDYVASKEYEEIARDAEQLLARGRVPYHIHRKLKDTIANARRRAREARAYEIFNQDE